MGAEIAGPDLGESESTLKSEKEDKIRESIDIDSALSIFDGAIEKGTPEELQTHFQRHDNEDRICVALPVNTDTAESRQDLEYLMRVLSHSILNYVRLDAHSSLGGLVRQIIGEATGDMAKHAHTNQRLDRLLVLVAKDGSEFSLQLINPAKASVDLATLDIEDNGHYKSPVDRIKSHGRNIVAGCERILEQSGGFATDHSHVVIDHDLNVGVLRVIDLKMPEDGQLINA